MILSESEKNRIRGLYGLLTEQDSKETRVEMTFDNNGFEQEVNDDMDELADVIRDFIVNSVKKSNIRYSPGAVMPELMTYSFYHNNDNFANDLIKELSSFLSKYNVKIVNHVNKGNFLGITLGGTAKLNETANIIEQSKLPAGIPAEKLPNEIKNLLKQYKLVGNFYEGDLTNPSDKSYYTFVPAHRMRAGINDSGYRFKLEDINLFLSNKGKVSQCDDTMKKMQNRKDELRKQGIKGNQRKEIINKEFGEITYCYSVKRINDIVEVGKPIS